MYHSARKFTVSDWIICPSLILPPSRPSVPPPRLTQKQRDAEEMLITGRTIWRPVPKDKQILRMYISAALSVFADVQRPLLEKRLGHLLTTFAETVEEILPFWDKLPRESQEAWACRAKDQDVKSHYVYLRMGSSQPMSPKKTKKKKTDEQEEMDDYETDPDELPGEVCVETEQKPMNWVKAGRHLMPRKASL